MQRLATQMAKLTRNEQGLVEAATPQAPSVQGDRNKQHWPLRNMTRHCPRHELGEANAPAMFEAHSNVAGHAAVADRCARAVVVGRRSETRAAHEPLDLHRHTAAQAALSSQESQRTPAILTDRPTFADNDPASGTARRKGEVQQMAQRRKHSGHSPLSAQRRDGTRLAMSGDDIFERKARRLRRDRMLSARGEDMWLLKRMAQDLFDRWQDSGESAAQALIIGYDAGLLSDALRARGVQVVFADPSAALARSALGVRCDEDRLPFADRSFDLIFWVGSLDSVNDVPGALILARRILRPSGSFLGSFLGFGSLSTLRDCTAEANDGPTIARLHPQIDVRAAGDLLVRAGFARSVADTETVTARYSSLKQLVADLRANGLTNVLQDRKAVTRLGWQQWCDRFESMRDAQGKVPETFVPIYLTGYSSDLDVPKREPVD
jgi:NADH dehydrogenase [ubiquinone] 1 alpha subcomplex assembly factor 5